MHNSSTTNLTHQILISQINGRTLCIPISDAISLDTLRESIHRIGGVHPEDQRLILNGNELIDSIKYQEAIKQKADFLSIKFALKGGCTGGKGGFGSLLRSAKSVKKTTNYGSCRDLHGRRLRDVQNERRLSEWSEKEKVKVREEKEVVILEEKEEKRRLRDPGGSGQPPGKLELQTKEITVGVGNSVEKGLALIKEKELKRKREEEEKNKDYNIKLFGLEDDDSEEEISGSDEQPQTNEENPSLKSPSNTLEPLKKKHCSELPHSTSSLPPQSLPPPTCSVLSSPLPPTTSNTTPSKSVKSLKLGPPVGSKRSADSSLEY